MFKSDNEYFILSFNHNTLVSAKECGVGEGLLEPPSRGNDNPDILGIGKLIEDAGENLAKVSLENPADKVLNLVDNVLSIGGTGTGGSGSGKAKDLSKKKKRRGDDRDGGGGRSY